MEIQQAKFEYARRMGDNGLILGHRLSEICGHGPAIETDIAVTNIALDLIGQARNWFTLAARLEGLGKTEDDYAYKRDVYQFGNAILCEQPNGHFGETIARQFYFDAFHFHLLAELCHSADPDFAAIAEKSLKEVTYHLRFSSEWVIRLGDGTEESHTKMNEALKDIWFHTGDLFVRDEVEEVLTNAGVVPDLRKIYTKYMDTVKTTISEANCDMPEGTYFNTGGKKGVHTEYLGFMLAELQFLPRAYPDAQW